MSIYFVFFKQKTAYEMRISDWSSDVCSSDLAYARSKDSRVRQVSASLAGSWQAVTILRADGTLVEDVRPLVRLNVSVVAGQGDRMESGSRGAGELGRASCRESVCPYV